MKFCLCIAVLLLIGAVSCSVNSLHFMGGRFDRVYPTKQLQKRYHLHDTEMTWIQAQQFCSTNSMRLATIMSREENDLINEEIRKTQGRDAKCFWIGAIKAENNEWRWFGQDWPLRFTEWSRGQPDNKEDENCVHLWYDYSPKSNSYSYQWNDNKCSTLFYPICEEVSIKTGKLKW